MSTQDILQQIDVACRSIATGRILSRNLAKLLKNSGLNEAEFRLLWLLQRGRVAQLSSAPDQKQLAEDLGLSPAQVSALVERLSSIQAIRTSSSQKDRRRQLWKIDTLGRELLEKVVLRLSDTTSRRSVNLPTASIKPREVA